ncbi:macrolide ABC transporter ATP-binding protein [Candidatus Nomurabacteria bacterium RIFCSPLOWO2_02_FULL_42_17]|uniref:Macrolide ABC transporter ATP-binding protein n=1 Tax=Candidatus Nomurabacteria bacterium RIFCSPLOWO2_02_FULL_42_17 TaxID=1801789 RepID=A0A1F6XPP3_9BACT|nr:MAG: ABC transporter related protein [Parcubacteria group bacterium GW2011_GWA2_42_18]OGI96140.1 MAG: macrolide ABC transporter ATP-binding protein [Candidatus Nomurabacteria bacterium RIFCSPLOWO2_02_FULL_42_17]
MPLIEIKNLEKIYHNDDIATSAIEDISLSINKGEFVAIMGPSGSGKSTLLHILGLLDKPTKGQYFLDDKEISNYSENELAKMRNNKLGFIFQSFNLLSRTTVFNNVKLPLLYSNIKQSLWSNLVLDAIESVGLSHRINHEPSQLSGGEKQRVAIARALVTKPNIIFADEPTGNLDSKSGKTIMEIIQKLNEKEGHTIILVTHETYTAQHAQRIINLLDGKIESDKLVDRRHKAEDHFKK